MTKNLRLCAGVAPVFGLAVLTFLALLAPARADDRGPALYERHCAPCHGTEGDGQGSAAYLLSPTPRDFTKGLYKFRSTPSGSPPTDGDLVRTLKYGVPGTAMPAWDRLPEEDLLAIVEQVKSFSDWAFEDEEDAEPPIAIGAPPASTPESQRAGRVVYESMKCAECHGDRGRGDGPSAATLRDDWKRPIRPYDFTRGASSMKGGASPPDIYRTFMTGLAGTPMPAYADLLSDTQGWQLVGYVQSLWDADAPARTVGTPTLQAVSVTTDLPLDPDAGFWQEVPATQVPLRPLWARDNRVDMVEVRAAVGPEAVAFRLEWRDQESNTSSARHQDYRDAVAIQFAPGGDPGDYVGLPFIGMGNSHAEVTVWHWKADWEADLAAGTYRDVEDEYAAMRVDRIDPRADETTDTLFLTGLAVDNSLSARERSTTVEALVATGFGTLTSLSREQQSVEGRGVWHDGSWSVVMRMALTTDVPPALRSGEKRAIAMAVWDGEAGDRDGQKVVSSWMELALE